MPLAIRPRPGRRGKLTSGIYFGEPRGIHDDNNDPSNEGGRAGIDTQRYTSREIRRLARSACELAQARQPGLLDGKGPM